jgi:8-oxo-dGTP pyrophosphatase MutT (NUDIX family)
MPLKPFPRSQSRIVLETPIFRVREDQLTNPSNSHTGNYYVLENPDWVNIIALTPERQILLVRQYRVGSQAMELELPAGMVEPGEDPVACAVRELEEETGHQPEKATLLATLVPNASYQQNRCSTILCEGCRPTGKLHFDPGEDVELVPTPVSELRGLIARGEMRSVFVLAALFLWLEKSGQAGWGGL